MEAYKLADITAPADAIAEAAVSAADMRPGWIAGDDRAALPPAAAQAPIEAFGRGRPVAVRMAPGGRTAIR